MRFNGKETREIVSLAIERPNRNVASTCRRTKFKNGTPGVRNFSPVYPRCDFSLFERSFEARSLLQKQRATTYTGRRRRGGIQISVVAVIKRNPRHECTCRRSCSFRQRRIISLPFVEPAIDLSFIPAFSSLRFYPFFFSFFFFLMTRTERTRQKSRTLTRTRGKKNEARERVCVALPTFVFLLLLLATK